MASADKQNDLLWNETIITTILTRVILHAMAQVPNRHQVLWNGMNQSRTGFLIVELLVSSALLVSIDDGNGISTVQSPPIMGSSANQYRDPA
ncbi:MAG: hypothetical protein M2R45_04661 [Verrucomicrobia subdivision 3 bacterium]|nr:hypothetical protein [Limisphaerales bacterium]MCS1416583.1 hypothetical protein [Limisphaerales bacterium]